MRVGLVSQLSPTIELECRMGVCYRENARWARVNGNGRLRVQTGFMMKVGSAYHFGEFSVTLWRNTGLSGE